MAAAAAADPAHTQAVLYGRVITAEPPHEVQKKRDRSSLSDAKLAFGSVMLRLSDLSSAGNPASTPPDPLATCQLRVKPPSAIPTLPSRRASWEVLLPALPAGALSPAHTHPQPGPCQHFLLPPALFLFPFIGWLVLPAAPHLLLPVCSGRSRRAVSPSPAALQEASAPLSG